MLAMHITLTNVILYLCYFQRKQVEECMFFLPVSLPKHSFKVLEEILEKYEWGSLVKLPKAKLTQKWEKLIVST